MLSTVLKNMFFKLMNNNVYGKNNVEFKEKSKSYIS